MHLPEIIASTAHLQDLRILSAASFPVRIAIGTPAGLYAHCPA